MSIEINLEFNSNSDARAVYLALLPETTKPPTERSKTKITLNDRKLYIQINAHDLVSIRAAFNSYMRMINAITECLILVKKYVYK